MMTSAVCPLLSEYCCTFSKKSDHNFLKNVSVLCSLGKMRIAERTQVSHLYEMLMSFFLKHWSRMMSMKDSSFVTSDS